jgi:hypothetical protein
MGNTTARYLWFWDIHLPMECGCENWEEHLIRSSRPRILTPGELEEQKLLEDKSKDRFFWGRFFQTDPAGEIEICSLSKKWGLSWILIKNEGLSWILIKNEGLSWILIYLAFKIANAHQIHRPKSRIGSWRAERRDAKRLAKRGSGEDSTIVSIALVVYTICHSWLPSGKLT